MDSPLWIDVDSPIGRIRVFESKGKISSVNIAVGKSHNNPPPPSALLLNTKKQLEDYFAGKLKKFNLPLDLTNGTEFQKSVWRQIAKIGFGKTLSYVEIAEAIGNPKASRAVGGAVGANPIPLIVGCHRVLGSSGKVTGYSGGKGIPTKIWLLKHEDIKATDA
ncbi:MAG: methylated-DNA--[protein]-cysteine S-methyltransferase [Microbacteriaceae bacterium]|nr:methylated-DNA--[protein]-cysteine S-methyltransferase [Microbacteriaceae bacterium]